MKNKINNYLNIQSLFPLKYALSHIEDMEKCKEEVETEQESKSLYVKVKIEKKEMDKYIKSLKKLKRKIFIFGKKEHTKLLEDALEILEKMKKEG